jgi:Flp pilus assembly protein TadB
MMLGTLPLTLCGAGFGLGLLLLLDGARPRPRAGTPARAGRLAREVRGRGPLQLAAVLAATALVALATRWLVAGLLAGLAAWSLPGVLMGAERARTARMLRLEAIATWTESLAATLSGAAGLEQAMVATAANAPTAISWPVTALGDALRAGARLPEALRAFAADLDDPIGDTVVAALLQAATHGAGRLSEPLTLLAAATREDVAARRRVEKSRAKAATDARMIIGVSLVMAVGLAVFNRGYLAPYDSLAGQGVLALVGALFAIGFRWLHRLSQQAEPARVLAFDTPANPGAAVTAAGTTRAVAR